MTSFYRAPFIVIWETTRACALACMAGTGRLPAIAGVSDSATAVTAEQVMYALREVLDPELGMSIVELGLVYGIDVHGSGVTVTRP
jgi:hypothetical protein